MVLPSFSFFQSHFPFSSWHHVFNLTHFIGAFFLIELKNFERTSYVFSLIRNMPLRMDDSSWCRRRVHPQSCTLCIFLQYSIIHHKNHKIS
jgi:hypothetical protein